MKIKSKFFVVLVFIIMMFLSFITSDIFAIKPYQKVDFVTGLVTATKLNVRSGPSTTYAIVATVNKNEYIRVFAQVGNWYIIQTDKDYIGAVSKDYIKPIYPNSSGSSNNTTNQGTGDKETSSELTEDEKEVFNLINKQRNNNGLSSLKIDDEVQNVARIKAKDMVDNNYFSHNSPIYGSPFDMLKSFKVSYKSAAENIAGNSTNSGAVNAWMNSSGHKANILNSSYNYTGVAVVKSNRYGKIFVQMFIGK